MLKSGSKSERRLLLCLSASAPVFPDGSVGKAGSASLRFLIRQALDPPFLTGCSSLPKAAEGRWLQPRGWMAQEASSGRTFLNILQKALQGTVRQTGTDAPQGTSNASGQPAATRRRTAAPRKHAE